MPVSRHEETGVKFFAEQFNGFIAGVPIKKRRFPLMHPSSSVPEEPCSLKEETELLQKEQSNSHRPTLSNSSVAGAPIKKRRFPLIQAFSSPLEEPCLPLEENDTLCKEQSSTSQGSTLSTSSSVLSNTNRNAAYEGRKESSNVTDVNVVQSNSDYLSLKLEQPNLATNLNTLDVLDRKENLIITESYGEKLGLQMIKEKPELLLAEKASLALNIGADIIKQNVEENCKQESPAFSEGTNLLLKLSLCKEEGSSKNITGDVKTNRANWDLNTTMDAWEESGSDATSVNTSIHGLKVTGSACSEKYYICSTGMEPTGINSLKQTNAQSQNRAFIISSRLDGQQFKCVDSRFLCLPSCLKEYSGEASRLSVEQNSDCIAPTMSLSNAIASAGDVNMASVGRVKSEPSDEIPKQNLAEAKPCAVGSFDAVTVKHELVERSYVESFKSSKGSDMNLYDPKLIKSVPGHEDNQEQPLPTESKSDQICSELPQGSENCPAIEKPVTLETTPISAETVCPPAETICSAKLNTSGSIVNHLENHASTEGACVDGKASQTAYASDEQEPPETVAIATPDNATESSGSGVKDSIGTIEENAKDSEGCRLKLMNELPSDPQGSGEGCVSDDEKITLLADMLEDDLYGYDYESDGIQSLTFAMDIEPYGEDDDYEDGEVRELLKHSVAEDSICELREVEPIACSNYVNRKTEKGVVSGDGSNSSRVEDDNRTVPHSEMNCAKDGVGMESNEKSDNVNDKILCLQEFLEAEKPTVGSENHSVRKNVLRASETELLSDQGTNESCEVDVAQCADEVAENLDMVRKIDSDLPNMELSVNTDDTTKDASNASNQGRTINLSQAASSSSTTKSRSISGRGLPSRAGRDVLYDAFDKDKLHRGRDEVFYIDGPHKFSRERHQDMLHKKRFNFVRGRRRVNGWLDTHCSEWESDREFAGQFYNGPSHFRAPRHKYVSAVHDADMEYNHVSPDRSLVGSSLVNRKPLNDEGPLGHYITSRRQSPGGRERVRMGHRITRTMSPSRCVGGDGSQFVAMRHNKKFMRGFPVDLSDPIFTRPQQFERLGGQFTRRNRNFSLQRRRPPQMHSTSPIRSGSRSPPGIWSSPRRRSPRREPDGFGGHLELAHRRSPLYRVDRMRSPVFPGERVVRRHFSPYMSRPSNDIRDIDSRRSHAHPRSFISDRSPSGRMLLRNRRFDVVDPQDSADNDEYFGGPMHSARLHEPNGEGNGDERSFGDRRGPVRSFRPPYNGSVGDNFHLGAQHRPRHYRFCADDIDFHERGDSLRERDFDRRIRAGQQMCPLE